MFPRHTSTPSAFSITSEECSHQNTTGPLWDGIRMQLRHGQISNLFLGFHDLYYGLQNTAVHRRYFWFFNIHFSLLWGHLWSFQHKLIQIKSCFPFDASNVALLQIRNYGNTTILLSLLTTKTGNNHVTKPKFSHFTDQTLVFKEKQKKKIYIWRWCKSMNIT